METTTEEEKTAEEAMREHLRTELREELQLELWWTPYPKPQWALQVRA